MMNLQKILIIICVASVSLSAFLIHKNTELKHNWSASIINNKAYESSLDSLHHSNIEFQYTIEQLKCSKDSLIKEANEIRKDLGIKDKNLKKLQYILSTSNRVDTIRLRDTIFKNPSLNIDTTLGDKWYNIKLSLKYPNTVIVSPEFKNKQFAVFNSRRETIKPPKKFFLWRWLQRKHEVVEVNIIEKNPYCILKEQKFINIIDD